MPKDFFCLDGASAKSVPNSSVRYCMEVTVPISGDAKSWLLEIATKEDMNDWIQKLHQASTMEDVSSAFGVQHNLHVDYNVRSSSFFLSFFLSLSGRN